MTLRAALAEAGNLSSALSHDGESQALIVSGTAAKQTNQNFQSANIFFLIAHLFFIQKWLFLIPRSQMAPLCHAKIAEGWQKSQLESQIQQKSSTRMKK
jgi:hypothetical protein